MAVPVAVTIKDRDNWGSILQIVLYFIAFAFIIYLLYKLFGIFRDWGSKIEENVKKAKEELEEAFEDWDVVGETKKGFEQTGKDVGTIVKGVLTGDTDSPSYNEAITRLHYGSSEYQPGGAGAIDRNTGVQRKYEYEIKPGETAIFHGGHYVETSVSNLVECPYSSKPVPKEECIALKYGFSSYASLNAWLEGVKAYLKAEGKDPSAMSLDELVQYGKELERRKRELQKKDRLQKYVTGAVFGKAGETIRAPPGAVTPEMIKPSIERTGYYKISFIDAIGRKWENQELWGWEILKLIDQYKAISYVYYFKKIPKPTSIPSPLKPQPTPIPI